MNLLQIPALDATHRPVQRCLPIGRIRAFVGAGATVAHVVQAVHRRQLRVAIHRNHIDAPDVLENVQLSTYLVVQPPLTIS
jgi:hypothetical protein